MSVNTCYGKKNDTKEKIEPGKAPRDDQQKSLDKITLITAIILFVLIFAFGYLMRISFDRFPVMFAVIAIFSSIDAVYQYYYKYFDNKVFYWQLFLSRIALYGFIGLDIIIIALQCT